MKIVINACYGGFGLSEKGMLHYASLKGIPLRPVTEAFGHTTYYTVPENETPGSTTGFEWSAMSMAERIAHNKRFQAATLSDHDIDRNDPDLVATVEALGRESWGECGHLEVVEIPDGVDWEIQEYDGNETIAERHRSWR